MNFLVANRPVLLGILNVTPDSFSDEGEHFDADVAVQHAVNMLAAGADGIDIGGESTRPGAQRVSADEQIMRVLPIIEELRARLPPQTLISIDTTLTQVGAAALGAGANMLNDVSAGMESAMFELALEHDVPIVLMHKQGDPASMQDNPNYEDVVLEVLEFLQSRAAAASAVGLRREQIVLDPGIGFGKSKAHNLDLIAQLDKLVACGYPVMLGASRKRFMGSICAETEFRKLVGATCATTALGVRAGVQLFRVHDIGPNRQAADVAWAASHGV